MVIICLCVLCVLFAVDILIQMFTAKKKVKRFRVRKYEHKMLEPRCVFIDFNCPHCEECHTFVIECDDSTINKINAIGTMRDICKRCPSCGCRLDWRN